MLSIPGGGGVLPVNHIGCATPKDRDFVSSFWSGIGYGFQGNYDSVRTYLLFQFQPRKKDKEICKFEMDF